MQDFIAEQLNSDVQLSSVGVEFHPEHSLDVEYEMKKHLGQQGIVGVVNTLKGTYGGHDGQSQAWEIEAEVDVIENPTVRRAQMKKMGLSAGTTADILDWIHESICGPASPTYGKFSSRTQEIGVNSGLVVGKAVMKTYAIADLSGIVSGNSNWHIPYALQSDLSALSVQVQEHGDEIACNRGLIDVLSAWISTIQPQDLSGYVEKENSSSTYIHLNQTYGNPATFALSGTNVDLIGNVHNTLILSAGLTQDESKPYVAIPNLSASVATTPSMRLDATIAPDAVSSIVQGLDQTINLHYDPDNLDVGLGTAIDDIALYTCEQYDVGTLAPKYASNSDLSALSAYVRDFHVDYLSTLGNLSTLIHET